MSRVYVFFFFSSRRRHTRCSRDWSSDVCSSDLVARMDFMCRNFSRWNADFSSAMSRQPGSSLLIRSEEHTSELQSRLHLVCRLLLEKKKKTTKTRSQTSSTILSFFPLKTFIYIA